MPSTIYGPHSLINEAKNISSEAWDTLLAASFLSLQWLATLWTTASFQSNPSPLIAASSNLNMNNKLRLAGYWIFVKLVKIKNWVPLVYPVQKNQLFTCEQEHQDTA